jgi:hypothetical protein
MTDPTTKPTTGVDMDADEYVVVAPYVTLKVKDQGGAFVIRGFNESGTVRREDIEDASLRHHLESGLMAAKDSPEARFAAPSGTPKPGEPPNVPVTEQPVGSLPLAERLQRQAAAADRAEAEAKGRPHGNASKTAWEDWAVAQRDPGVSEDDARTAAKALSKEELVAKYGRRGETPRDRPSAVARPALTASKDEWVAYAVTQRPEGMAEEEARDEYGEMTHAELVAQADAQAEAEAAAEGKPGEQRSGRPDGRSSQATWLNYAVSQRPEGMTEEEARDAYGDMTKAELVAQFGN